ncbi:hypothetical protein BC827DRAFT_1219513 [Russula dissimulans]|nr:hypothetical protein BC827DRAFT_1219513 [Russula dissimulans]
MRILLKGKETAAVTGECDSPMCQTILKMRPLGTITPPSSLLHHVYSPTRPTTEGRRKWRKVGYASAARRGL